MTDSVLYIIGNGFDLFHGIKSSYGSFRKWLQTHDYDTYQTYETVCDYDALWSDFETGMAYVSRDFFLESGLAICLHIPPYRRVIRKVKMLSKATVKQVLGDAGVKAVKKALGK